MKPGSRKFTAFIYCLISFSLVTMLAVFILSENPAILPSFVFQLASAYGIISGLFFGSNVLEHYAKRGGSSIEKTNP